MFDISFDVSDTLSNITKKLIYINLSKIKAAIFFLKNFIFNAQRKIAFTTVEYFCKFQ